MNKDIEKMLINNGQPSLLFRFAYLGKKEDTYRYLKELSELAEDEIWTSKEDHPFDILLNYITYTFDKACKDDLIILSDDKKYAAFNTGLLTPNGEDIICMFNSFEGSKIYKMHLYGFRKESDWEFLKIFPTTPEVVTYFSNPEKIYFNPNLQLTKNLDHILEDNFNRFPTKLQEKGKEYILALLSYALNLTLKRCKRNYRIAVPQYYNDEITYLLPITLDGYKMALAVGYVNQRYRVNTVFTLEIAYKNARLLMKPEADWLELRSINPLKK